MHRPRRTPPGRTLTVLAAALLLAAGCTPEATPPPAAPTVVLVVRHAEKAGGSDPNPPLTEAGRQRAEALLTVTGSAGVQAIYASQYERTRATGRPLAERQGLDVAVFEISRENMATYPQQLAAHILSTHVGETVLVVNHSNTVPAIVEALGGGPAPALTEDDYDDLFVVIIAADGAVKTLHTQYGR